MQFFRILVCLTLGLTGLFSMTHAEDIDLYSANATNTGVPNVLLVLDNAANFSATADGCTYVDGTAPSLNGTAGGIEQCAIYNVISGLPAGAVNLGLMVYNATNIRDVNNANCGGSDGGCLVQPLALMSGTAKTNFLAWIKTWNTTGGAGNGYIKATGEATGATMQEAWAYYAGSTGLSGRSYAGVKPAAGCQKNFVIFIGNAFDTNGTPSDTGTADPIAALASAPGVTAAQRAIITVPSGSYGTGAFSCKFGNPYSMGNDHGTKNKGLYADEWARYMYQTDIYGTLDDNQGITTYTVGLLSSGCRADYPALLTSMAKVGGGKYFATSSYSEISTAILAILNEIQAVNSVFASASLPVSVNAQGTYLNQIFLGMFRPDASANPRWLGNLKQYEFKLNYLDPSNPDPNTAELQLADSVGASAISASGTGFITPVAISYWTSKDITRSPDAPPPTGTGGFYVNDQRGTGLAFDSPDGELVEKGGAAQQSRLQNLIADFAATAGTSTNPRRLYTYCPGGSSCNPLLTHASNAFSIENVAIGASAFGSSTSIKINSIVRTGSTALVTTAGNHGFGNGATVTISNSNQTEYNVTQAVTVNSATTFTITGLPDYPTTPSVGAYTFATIGASGVGISTMSRSTSTTGGNNSETVTVTTTASHVFAAGSSVTISGAAPASYNGNWTIALPATVSCPAATCFTYSIPVYPSSTATGFSVVVAPYSRNVAGITDTGAGGTATVTTSTAHGFHVGQIVTISGTGQAKYDGFNFTVASVPNTTTFTFTGYTGNPGAIAVAGTVSPTSTAQTISFSRVATTNTATATGTGAASNVFGRLSGDTKVVNITKAGAPSSETAYAGSNVTITCTNAGCTTFTYSITTSPSPTISLSGATAAPASGGSVTIAAGGMTRSGSTATVTGATANLFGSAVGATKQVNISASGAAFAEESAYLGSGTWTITCSNASCTTFTFGPVTLSPTTPATGNNMQAYSGSSAPDATALVKWVRGQDNLGDELGPTGSTTPVTVRPSIHGDVLHSRPAVINYGDSRGLVVYYGSNDGVFRAVNGSQDTAVTSGTVSVPPGGELWGLVLPEHFSQLNRQRVNSPELRMPTTLLASALPKDYFVDGTPGLYQKLKADGSTARAIIYLTMRRGGRFMYALDVSEPGAPTVLWKRSFSDSGLEELGQTWSRPRVTLVKGYANPVLVFGAGYDPAEDTEPPTADSMGRGIFVLDALSGAMVWRAAYSAAATTVCSGSATQAACAVAGMNWAIPADISFADRNLDGLTDRFYAADLGGNVWRVDLEPTAGNTPDKWQVSKVAALGCSSGACTIGTTPRKFFFPPNVVPVGVAGASGSYDAVMLGSGDREHPLQNAATGSSYNVTNRFYLFKDTATGLNASGTVITEASLVNLGTVNGSTIAYDASLSGFYISYATGEKSVNAPVTTFGTTYFGTNRPTPPSATSCKSNLGEAKGYALDPFSGTFTTDIFDGGGLPPTPTAGIVTIAIPARGSTPASTVQKAFCVGCGGTGGGGDAKSALGAGDVGKNVPKSPRRSYWYKQ